LTESEETALLTDLGLEVEMVEKYQSVKGGLEGIVTSYLLVPHPDADRLKITNSRSIVPYKLFVVLQMLLQVKKSSSATIGTNCMIKKELHLPLKKVRLEVKKATV
jgi:phenylalanyl-tRNA synthetase beta chain